MNVIEEKIIVNTFMDIIKNGKFPEFGSSECKCNKYMFNKIICPSSNKPDVTG
jgi:hypothetical protein